MSKVRHHHAKSRKNGAVTGYRFLDKDPIIDVFREAMRQSGKTASKIADDAGLARTTTRGWDVGDTRRPQHVTLRAAMAACGYREVWMSNTGNISMDYDNKKIRVTSPS